MDSRDGSICGNATIPSGSCIDGICKHTFTISTSSCPPLSNINVTVFGTNQLGNGTNSDTVTIGELQIHVF